jgi:hypothetical protein
MPDSFSTPIVFAIFNRPETTRIVFDQIRNVRPRELFIIADGPRSDHLNDREKCNRTRSIVKDIDWECQVYQNFSSENMGAGPRMATGITWAFDHVDQAIILEDDCLPSMSFFRFCEELLAHYANDARIMHISGNNFLPHEEFSQYSYLFSMYSINWGWATWKRAWKMFDYNMKQWPYIRDHKLLKNIIHDRALFQFWQRNLEKVFRDGRDVWDYRWLLSCWVQNGLSILPSRNLVKNIGIGPDATHTKRHKFSSQLSSSEEVSFPLNHPPFFIKSTDCETNMIKRLMEIDQAYEFKQNIKYHFFANRSPRDYGILSKLLPRK